MFEAQGSQATQTPVSAIWARWINPNRWEEWDPRVESASAEGELAVGTEVRVKMRKGGTVRQHVVALEPDHLLVTEYPLPGGRVGHEHRVVQRGAGAQVTHRLYVEGWMSGLWAMMLGRKKMQEAVANFDDADRPR